MIKRILAVLFLLSALSYADYSENVIWRFTFDTGESGYSNFPARICQKEYQATILHANPYRIGSLNWNYASGSSGWGRWGISSSFQSYSLSGLYDDYSIALGGAYRISDRLFISVDAVTQQEKFGERLYKSWGGNIKSSYSQKVISISGGIDRIWLNQPYHNSAKNGVPYLTVTAPINSNSRLGMGYIVNESSHGRWMFYQNIVLVEKINVDLGYISKPDILQCGLDFGWKSLRFGVIYQGIDKLDDTIIWSISTGK